VTGTTLEIEATPAGAGVVAFSAGSSTRHANRQAATERRQLEVRESVGSLHAFVDLVDHTRRTRVRGIGLLAFLNAADVLTTSIFLRLGAAEGNPALAPVAMHWWLLLIIKGAIIALVAKCVLAAPPRSTLARRLVNAATVYYAAVVLWNVITIVRL
jgi:hypothetical protein